MLRTAARFLLVLLAACGTTAATEGASEPGGVGSAEPVSSSSIGTAAASPSSGLEIHEWALVDVLANGTTELASGPGHPALPMAVRKPVVYVHLADGIDEASFSLEARMTSGAIVEHWPAGALDGARVRWDVRARREHCDTVVSAAGRARWATPADGVTELPDLPGYDAPSAACLTVADTASGMLFYRGTMGAPSLPLTVVRGADGSVTVTATGDTTGTPGEILRVSTGLSGPWPPGHVVVSRAAVPARGASVVLPVGTDAIDASSECRRLSEAMLALGLAQDEADAFVRAWSQSLFGAGGTDARGERRDSREPASTPAPPQDAILFWLPVPAIDAIATLTIDPAPSAVRRAFLVRVELPAVDTASLSRRRPAYAAR